MSLFEMFFCFVLIFNQVGEEAFWLFFVAVCGIFLNVYYKIGKCCHLLGL